MNIINQNKETIKNLCETHNVESYIFWFCKTDPFFNEKKWLWF
jgi:hypothetical protein